MYVMVKLFGVIAVLVGAGGVGVSFANDIRNEISHLQEIHRMTGFLCGEIACCNALLRDSAMSAAQRLKEPYSTFLAALGDEIEKKSGESFSSIWNRLAVKHFCTMAWKKTELEMFLQLGEHLGYLNQSMQLSILEQYRTDLMEKIKEKQEERNTKVKLYHCLGIAGGLFIVILLL